MSVMPTSSGGSPARSSCCSWNRFGQLDTENGSVESPSPQPVEKPVRTVVPIGSCRWVRHRHGPHGCNRRACAGPGPGGPAPVPQVRTPHSGRYAASGDDLARSHTVGPGDSVGELSTRPASGEPAGPPPCWATGSPRSQDPVHSKPRLAKRTNTVPNGAASGPLAANMAIVCCAPGVASLETWTR